MEPTRNCSHVKLLQQSELFHGLSKNDLNTIYTYCEYRDYPEGSVIRDEQPFSGHMYIIEEGDVVITRGDGSGANTVLARFLSGECFGELDLLSASGNAVRIAAERHTQLLMFPKDGVDADKLLSKHSQIGAKVVRNILTMVARRIRSTNHLISQRSPWVQELRKQVFVDKLTGIYNKTWLAEELENEVSGRRSGTAALVIKPDNFKVINDTYGHDAGDQTLSILGNFVQNAAGESGLPARHGGDVFAVIHPSANAREIATLAGKIVRTAKQIDLRPIVGEGEDGLELTVSVGGAARKPGSAEPMTQVVERAFQNMLKARESGGDRIYTGGRSNG